MFLVILILSIFIFTKTIGYAIYEYNNNSNKVRCNNYIYSCIFYVDRFSYCNTDLRKTYK